MNVAGFRRSPARPVEVHANDAGLRPEPPVSAALSVNATGRPGDAVAGPAIVPVGLTMSGIMFAAA